MATSGRPRRDWAEVFRRRPSKEAESLGPLPGNLEQLMERVLRAATPLRMAELLLADDPLSGRLRTERWQEAARYGVAAGSGVAAEVLREKRTANPFALAESLGVAVKQDDQQGQVGPRVHYSQYSAHPPAITIYRQSMDAVNAAIREHGLAESLGLYDITPIHTAHELYHHVEMHRKPSPTAGFRVTTLALGPVRLDSGLPTLSEIAANGFAQALLGLRYYPTVLEFITVFQHNPHLAWARLATLEERR
ncbi:MAG: hypothetical protein ACYC3S_18485 [Chloroflexota bacterium]